MTTKEFAEKLAQDEALGKKLAARKAPEQAYALAQKNGVTDAFETFTAAMREAYNQAKSELSDEELAQIAGGLIDTQQNALIATGTVGGFAAWFAAVAWAA